MKTVYIVCEDEKCEPAYFEKFQKLYAKELYNNQIKILQNDIQSAIDRAKGNIICKYRCFSCYATEDLILNTQHSIQHSTKN